MGYVVVTGASGFIGSAVVRRLIAAGRRVLAVVEPGAADTANLAGLDVERITADVVDATAMARACSGAEAVYHLAAVYRIWLEDPSVIYRVNIEGTTTVLLAALRAGVPRVVYTASIAAIGLRSDGRPSDESVPFNLYDIANDYILTKHLSERIAHRFAQAGLPLVTVCPSFPFGERDRGPTPTGKILLNVAAGRVPGYPPGGFNVIDVENVALGHLLAEERGVVGERYILGDHNVSLEEFAQVVAHVAGTTIPQRRIPAPVALGISWLYEQMADHITHREPRTTVSATRFALRHAHYDCTKARRDLGLPSTPLEDTISRALNWFRDNGYGDTH